MNRSKKMATAICGMFAVGAGLMFGRPAILADEFPPPDTELNDLPGDLPMGRYIEYIATDVSTNSVTLSNGVLVVGSEALDLFEMTNLTYEAAVLSAATAATNYTDTKTATKQDKLPYPTNAIPQGAVSELATSLDNKLNTSGGTLTGGLYFNYNTEGWGPNYVFINLYDANPQYMGSAIIGYDSYTKSFEWASIDESYNQTTVALPVDREGVVALRSDIPTAWGWGDITNKPNLATVATSGSYNDLFDKPTIPTVPTDVSAFNNDAGYVTESVAAATYQPKGDYALALALAAAAAAATNHTDTSVAASATASTNYTDAAVAAAATASTNYTDASISPTSPAFSNAVLSVGLSIDTNTVAVINELVDSAHSLPLTGATSVGALLLALAAAIAALKRGKVDCVSPATDGDIAALDANGNLKLSGMNRDGNGNLDATEFTFTPSQVADYDSASVGTVINKATTPVVLHNGQHYVARKSFVKTNGGWNVDSVTGRVVLPGASGIGSTALGDATQAMGSGAVSTGKNTKASGAGAVSSGQETDAIGTGAHAEGQSTSATATCAHSEGYFTIAQNQSEHAQGEYNASHTGATESERTLNSIGIGNSTERKNAVEVMRDGKVFVVGIGGYDGTNPTVSGVLDLATAVKSDLRYSLVTKTISGGAVTLDDRADNYVDARTLGSSDSLDIDFPALVDGKSRDFVLAVECGANPPTISYAAFVTIMAEDASTLTPEHGMNIYAFTEFKTNMFIASRKLISTVVDNSPESGVQLLLAMQKRGIDTSNITDFGGVETALGLSDSATLQDAIDVVMN